MRLRFRGPGADGRPADQILQVLWRDGIQRFGGQRQAEGGDIEQQLAGDVQALGNLECIVEVRVVDQILSSQPWFLAFRSRPA